MSDRDTILAAKIALTKVLSDKGINPANPEVFYWMLGQAYTENGFGVGPSWTIPNALNDATNNPLAPNGPSYNWGAVRTSGTNPFIWHMDNDSTGKPFNGKFARFTDHEGGANTYLRALLRLDINDAVKNVLNDPNATTFDLARSIYTRNVDPSILTRSQMAYYTGTTGTDQQRIQAYANMVQRGAASVKKALGSAPGGTPPSTPPSSGNLPGSGTVPGSGAIALALATGLAYGLYRLAKG